METLKLCIVLMFAVCYSDEGKIIITLRQLYKTDDSNTVLLKGYVFLLLLIVCGLFWVEANVSILWCFLCFFYICIAIGDQFL